MHRDYIITLVRERSIGYACINSSTRIVLSIATGPCLPHRPVTGATLRTQRLERNALERFRRDRSDSVASLTTFALTKGFHVAFKESFWYVSEMIQGFSGNFKRNFHWIEGMPLSPLKPPGIPLQPLRSLKHPWIAPEILRDPLERLCNSSKST